MEDLEGSTPYPLMNTGHTHAIINNSSICRAHMKYIITSTLLGFDNLMDPLGESAGWA